jgi:hypothetical protein
METANIEKAFESLLQELEGIKKLNEVAVKHKENTELLANKLQEYYIKSTEIDKIISTETMKCLYDTKMGFDETKKGFDDMKKSLLQELESIKELNEVAVKNTESLEEYYIKAIEIDKMISKVTVKGFDDMENGFLQELEGIKELNEIVVKHKENTELLANKLQEYYIKSSETDKILSHETMKGFDDMKIGFDDTKIGFDDMKKGFLQELEGIKELNEIAVKHKENTELLANKFQEYYIKSSETDKILSNETMKGFDDMKKGFDDMKKGFDDTNKGFDDTKKGFDDTRKGFDDTKKGFDDTRKGFDDTRKGFDDTKKGFDDMRTGFDDTQKGFADMKKGFGDTQKGFGDTQKGFDDMKKQFLYIITILSIITTSGVIYLILK